MGDHKQAPDPTSQNICDGSPRPSWQFNILYKHGAEAPYGGAILAMLLLQAIQLILRESFGHRLRSHDLDKEVNKAAHSVNSPSDVPRALKPFLERRRRDSMAVLADALRRRIEASAFRDRDRFCSCSTVCGLFQCRCATYGITTVSKRCIPDSLSSIRRIACAVLPRLYGRQYREIRPLYEITDPFLDQPTCQSPAKPCAICVKASD